MAKGRPAKDFTGAKIGMLRVIKRTGESNKHGSPIWECICDCGKTCYKTSQLLRADVKSCGCLLKLWNYSHGMCGTAEYRTWRHMKDRCLNKDDKNYDSYGGRGIMVCDEWLDFKDFYNDMGKKPKGYSLDRIDNNGNYCKENCRWASRKTQVNNRKNSIVVEIEGVEDSLHGWSQKLGFSYGSFYHRMRRGEDIEEIFKEICGKNVKRIYR